MKPKHKNKVGAIYTQVAALLNVVEGKEWKLIPKFQQSYCAFYVGRKTIFGVNFEGPPRFAVWMEKKEAERLSNYCEFERYSDRHCRADYPTYTPIDELLPIFEYVYLQVEKLALSESRGLEYAAARARQVLLLLDQGMTPEEIDALLSKASS